MDIRRRTRPARAVLALAAVSLLAAPAPVLGAAATKASDHYVEVFCDALTGSAGTIFLDVILSDVNGVSANLDDFGPGAQPFVDPAIYRGDFNRPPSGSYSGGLLSASIPVMNSADAAAGSAQLTVNLVAGGDPQPIGDSYKDGNHQFRSSGSLQPLSIQSGMIGLPDGSSFSLSDGPCAADEVQITFFGTNPTSAVRHFDSNNMNCPLMAGNTQVGNLFVDVDADRTVAFVDAFFFDSGLDGNASGSIAGGHLATPLDFMDVQGQPAGTGSIDMTIATTGQRFEYTLRSGTQLQRVRGEAYDVSGTLTAPGFAPFDLGGCVLADRSTKEISKPVQAPKPTGKAPSNDLPTGATLVRPRTSLTENTKNAALDMEAPFACLTYTDNGVEQPIPVIKTVWFALAGTNSNVTIDTAGSGFDTVVAVYTRATDGSYVPVPNACVDDVPLQPLGRTLQAATTFAAAAGTTYYVQVGGFPDDLNWGDLHLSVR